MFSIAGVSTDFTRLSPASQSELSHRVFSVRTLKISAHNRHILWNATINPRARSFLLANTQKRAITSQGSKPVLEEQLRKEPGERSAQDCCSCRGQEVGLCLQSIERALQGLGKGLLFIQKPACVTGHLYWPAHLCQVQL